MHDGRYDRNHEGYKDTTPYMAMYNQDKEKQKVTDLINAINTICDLAGFKVEGRIVLKNKKSERVWK